MEYQATQHLVPSQRDYDELGMESRVISSSLTPRVHQFPSLVLHDDAYVHQGDIYYQNIALGASKTEIEHKSFGLCLGDAPSTSSDAFKGREDDLEALRNYLLPTDRSGPGHVISIVGTGGLGKTQLSLAYARAYAQSYSSVFWLNANDETTLRQSMASLAEIIFSDSSDGCYQTPEAEKLAVERVRQWLSEPANNQWLLIFDNYDNPHFSKTQPSTTNGFDIRPFFPIRSHGSIVITTRSTKVFFSQQLQLKEIQDVSTSVSILSQRSHRDLSIDPQASDLAQRLGGLPLALATAGTFLASTTMSCSQYRQLYESKWTDLFGSDMEELSEYPQRTLSTTWTISLEYVRTQDEDAAELLEFLAFFSPRDIWYELIKADASVEMPWLERLTRNQIRFQQAMAKLRESCLIEIMAGSYQMHPCLHDWLVTRIGVPPKLWFIAAVTCVSKGIPDFGDIRAQHRNLLDHIEHLQSRHFLASWDIYFDDERVCEAASRFALLQRSYGFYSRAETMYHLVLKGAEREYGPGHVSTLEIMTELGALYFFRNRLDTAEKLLKQALAGILQRSGLKYDSSLETLTSLDTRYQNSGILKMLEQISAQLLGRPEEVPKSYLELVFSIVYSLGHIYRRHGKLVESVQAHEWLLVEYEKVFGSQGVNLLLFSSALGETLKEQGKLDMAEYHLTTSLARVERMHGSKHFCTLYVLHRLGMLYDYKGELDKAQQVLKRAFAGQETLLGPEHPDTLHTIHDLGVVFRRQGELSKAEQMLTRALTGKQRVFGPESVEVLDTVQCIGNLYLDQCRFSDAEQAFLQVLVGHERILGPEHNRMLYPLRGLKKLYTAQQNWDLAETFQRRISSIEEINEQVSVTHNEFKHLDTTLTSAHVVVPTAEGVKSSSVLEIDEQVSTRWYEPQSFSIPPTSVHTAFSTPNRIQSSSRHSNNGVHVSLGKHCRNWMTKLKPRSRGAKSPA